MPARTRRIISIPPYTVGEEISNAVSHGFGALLADEMGLGKTVQAIATAEMLRDSSLADSVLVVCPTSLKYQCTCARQLSWV